MKRLVTLCLVGLLGVSACSNPSRPTLRTLNGKTVSFNDEKKPWVLINYWASWCAPCLKEIPALNQFQAKHPEVVVLGVNMDGLSGNSLQQVIKRFELGYDSLLEEPSKQLDLGTLKGIPASFLFKQGSLVKTWYGPQTLSSLESALS